MSLRLVGTMFWLAQLGLAMLLVVIAMIIIMCACDAFEPASEYLGEEVYHMVRGAPPRRPMSAPLRTLWSPPTGTPLHFPQLRGSPLLA